jgi:hypothetical protein
MIGRVRIPANVDNHLQVEENGDLGRSKDLIFWMVLKISQFQSYRSPPLPFRFLFEIRPIIQVS